MKFALVQEQRQTPSPSKEGTCPACGRPVTSKCGEIRIWHWAHQRGYLCDPWWENETEWHRSWKDSFPVEWQEVVETADNGERHIADVKTPQGWVLEFQHSSIARSERASRDSFYFPKLVWVVDGTKKKRDLAQLQKARAIGLSAHTFKILTQDSRLLSEWKDSSASVFFDLRDIDALWWLQGSADGWSYIARISRLQFLNLHNGRDATDFDALVSSLRKEFTRINLASSTKSLK